MLLEHLLLTSLFLISNFYIDGSQYNFFEKQSKLNYLKYLQSQNLVDYNNDFVDTLYENEYIDSDTTITVLTHGMYGSMDYWFPKINGNTSYFDEDSLPYKIIDSQQFQNNAIPIFMFTPRLSETPDYLGNDIEDVEIYHLVEVFNNFYSFELFEFDSVAEVKELFSYHTVFLYQGPDNVEDGGNTSSNVSKYFCKSLDTVLARVAALRGGKLPKINLIGHSRGGILNLYYASRRELLVDNFITISTPFNGSLWAEVLNSLCKLGRKFSSNEFFEQNYDGLLNDTSDYEEMMASMPDIYKIRIGCEMTPDLFCGGILQSLDIINEPSLSSFTFGNQNIVSTLINMILDALVDNPNILMNGIVDLASSISNFCQVSIGSLEVIEKLYDFFSNLVNGTSSSELIELKSLCCNFLNDVINLCNSISSYDHCYNCIKGDFCVDLDSQFGNGFTTNYFNKTILIPFGTTGYTNLIDKYLSNPNLPKVAHNYESIFPTITQQIVDNLLLRNSIDAVAVLDNTFPITISPYRVPFYNLTSSQIEQFYLADYNFFGDEFGFRDYYYYENQIIINEYLMERYIDVNDLRVDTLRMRTGFIQNERIVLSPNRTNAGLAFIEFYLDKTIRGMSFDVSLWSSNESVISSNLAFVHTTSENFSHYIRIDDNYYFAGYSYQFNSMTERGQAALLNDNGMFSNTLVRYNVSDFPVLRNYPTTKYIVNEDGFSYVGFYAACNVNSNDRNKGRICLSNFNIYL